MLHYPILHIAAETNAPQEIVTLLLESNARELLKRQNFNKQLPLHLVKRPDICKAFCDAIPKDTLTQETITNLRKAYSSLNDSCYREMSKILDLYDSNVAPRPVPRDLKEMGEAAVSEVYSSMILPILKHGEEATNELANEGIDQGKEKVKETIQQGGSPDSKSDS